MSITQQGNTRVWFATLLLILLGLNLRPLLTSIGPLTQALQEASGMPYSSFSLLTTIPIMMIGILALFAGRMTRALGYRRGIAVGLLVLIGGLAIRAWPASTLTLLTSAVVGGFGIALLHIIIPELTKQQFRHRLGAMTGLWSAALMGGAALGAVLTPWLDAQFSSHSIALASWSVLAVMTLSLWLLPANRVPRADIPPRHELLKAFKFRRSWLLGAYFALVNAGYAGFIAWIAPFYGEFGWTTQQAGNLLALFSLVQVMGALILPTLSRSMDRRPWLALAVMTQMVGFAGLCWLPEQAPWLWSALCGFGLGGAFPLCIVMALDHIDDPVQSGRLVSFMQGIGFIFASIMPLVTGAFRDLSGEYQFGWAFHIVVGVAILLMTTRFSPAKYRSAFLVKR